MSGIVTKKDLIRERSMTAGGKARNKQVNAQNPYGYVGRSQAGVGISAIKRSQTQSKATIN
jgi:hypothetical protein